MIKNLPLVLELPKTSCLEYSTTYNYTECDITVVKASVIFQYTCIVNILYKLLFRCSAVVRVWASD